MANEPRKLTIDSLPRDVFRHVLTLLPECDRVRARAVNKSWRERGAWRAQDYLAEAPLKLASASWKLPKQVTQAANLPPAWPVAALQKALGRASQADQNIQRGRAPKQTPMTLPGGTQAQWTPDGLQSVACPSSPGLAQFDFPAMVFSLDGRSVSTVIYGQPPMFRTNGNRSPVIEDEITALRQPYPPLTFVASRLGSPPLYTWSPRMVWSPDGMRLATTTAREVVQIHAMANREAPITIQHRSAVGALVWNGSGDKLATGDFFATQITDIHGHAPVLLPGIANFGSIAWSPSGLTLAITRDGTTSNGHMTLYQAATGKALGAPTETSGLTPAWSPNGRWIATAHGSNALVIDAHTSKVACTLPHASDVSWLQWNHDGSKLATQAGQGVLTTDWAAASERDLSAW